MSHSHLVERLDDNGNTITVISVNIVQSNDVKMFFFKVLEISKRPCDQTQTVQGEI